MTMGILVRIISEVYHLPYRCLRIDNRGTQTTNCMEHDEGGSIPLSPKQWIELFKMMPPIGKAFLIVSQLIVLGIIGYVLVG